MERSKKHNQENLVDKEIKENQITPEENAKEMSSDEKEILEQQEQENGDEQADKANEAANELLELKDKYLRLAAEFDNYRRRTLKEKQDLISYAAEGVIKEILPVLDDFERAIEMLSSAKEKNDGALEGTELIYNKLKSTLISKGVKEIEAIGMELDTDLHEAVAQMEINDKSKKNKVIDVVQRGYTLNGKVIRFAKVVMGQ